MWRKAVQKKMPSLYVLAAVAALAMLSPGVARADSVFVECDADPATLTPPTYPTIAAALAALEPLPGSHTIQVTGTCVENVDITNRDHITIQAPEGQTATISRPPDLGAGVPTMHVQRSRNIQLRRLILRDGGGAGLLATRGSDLTVTDLTLENNTGAGLNLGDQSFLATSGAFIARQNGGTGISISNSVFSFLGGPAQPGSITAENNGGAGISVGPRSFLTVGRDDGFGPVRISGNAGVGMSIGGQSQVNINGDTIIENSEGSAINVNASGLVLSATLSQNIVRNNGFGINVSDTGTLGLSGNNLIQNNGGGGVQVFRSAVLTVGSRIRPTDSVEVGLVVEGHTGLGLNIVQGAAASLGGVLKIRDNGADSTQPEIAGGIRVARASLSIQGQVEVTSNTGAGIRMTTDSSAIIIGPAQISNNLGPGILADLGVRLEIGPASTGAGPLPSPTVISGNSGEGILLAAMSAMRLYQAPTMTGNTGGTIVCDKSSWLFGHTAGIAEIACQNVDATKKK
jgi:hypothetical protein